MEQTISRNEQSDGTFIVQRIKNGELQAVKEVIVTTGEINSVDSEMITTETITITRYIGEKNTF